MMVGVGPDVGEAPGFLSEGVSQLVQSWESAPPSMALVARIRGVPCRK